MLVIPRPKTRISKPVDDPDVVVTPHVVVTTTSRICKGEWGSRKSKCEDIGQPQIYRSRNQVGEENVGLPEALTGVADYNLNNLVSDSWLEQSPISDNFYHRLRDRSYKSQKVKSKIHVWFSFRLTTIISWGISQGCVVNQTEFTANVYIQSSELGRSTEHPSVMTKCPDHPHVQRLRPKITSISTPVLYVTAEFELPARYCILPVESVKKAVSAVQSWVVLPKWCDVCTFLGILVVKPGKGQDYTLERIWVNVYFAPACGKDNPYGWGKDHYADVLGKKPPSLKSPSSGTQKGAVDSVKDSGAAVSTSIWSWGENLTSEGALYSLAKGLTKIMF
jgi:hypothetical protein